MSRTLYLILISGALLTLINCSSDESPKPSPTAQFKVDKTLIVKGETVQFTDQSEGNPTTWCWTFEGGEPSTSEEQNPAISYSEIGKFDVTLEVKIGDQSDFISADKHIEVIDEVFEIEPIKNVVYGIDEEQHILDLYMPKDATTKTPLIIMMGGGGFYGWSGLDLMLPLVNQLVPRGIAVASARYRKVLPPKTPDRYQEGIINSSQDAKAAVRYFRATHTEYNIDPKVIIIGGNSSGAIGSLVAAYYDWKELPAFEQSLIANHGGLEGAQGSMEYSSEVAGIISLAGEMIVTTNFIDSTDPPFFGVCAFGDSDIACDTRVNPGGFTAFGAIPINDKAKEVGLHSDAYVFEVGTHDTPRERPQDYINKLMEWLEPIMENPPSYDPKPFIFYESFNEDCIPSGWSTVIIQNESFDWECKSDEGGSLYINSFAENGDDNPTDNWLISEPIRIEDSPDPMLLFDYTLRFEDIEGYGLQLYASTLHDGDFQPGEWVSISPLYDRQNVSTLLDDFENVRINIGNYNNQEVHFAFRYTSSGSISKKSLEVRVDNFRIMK